MDLITAGSVGKAIGTDKPTFDKLNNYILKTLKLNQINELYSNNFKESGAQFIEKILRDLNITLKISEEDLKKIPNTGSFISTSNHPFGAIDGLILIYLISKKRKDFKVMANFLLEMVEPIKDQIIPVNPFKKKKKKESSIEGLRKGIKHLNAGHPIGIFPAGEVSTIQNLKNITDKTWNHSMIKFIKRSKVPVLPVYFHGMNSISFHVLGLINANLRTAKLPAELLNKRDETITIRIGNIIDIKQQDSFVTTSEYGKFIRAKTYALGTQLDVNNFFKYNQSFAKLQKPLITSIDTTLLLKDIFSLPEEAKLFTWGDYEIYNVSTSQIPNLISEIGRIRELTFRGVEEGTGKALDLDSFDLYYKQLFIWDSKNDKLVGGYRIGFGKEIIEAYEKKGFYLNTLFKFNKNFSNTLKQSIELGRSFVTPDYQKKAFPLFCLWKGILKVLLSRPEYRYLLGPVTISNGYSKLSKNLIIDYIKNNHYDFNICQLVKPRKKYKVKYKSDDYELFLHSSTNLNLLDEIIEDIEIGKLKVPILFKKYLQQNAKIIGFNRDPKFNNALDALMILDVSNIPVKTLKNLSSTEQDYSFISYRFYGQYHATINAVPQY